MKTPKPCDKLGFGVLQCCFIFIKEVFKLFIGQHLSTSLKLVCLSSSANCWMSRIFPAVVLLEEHVEESESIKKVIRKIYKELAIEKKLLRIEKRLYLKKEE